MSGLGMILPGTSFDPTLPFFRDDFLLSVGSLVLIDFAHSINPLVGVPVAGTGNIPNLAYKEAAALHGSGTQADWALNANINLAPADGFIERSGKGGLHVCMSQAGVTGSAKGVSIERIVASGSKLLQYLFTNRAHKFYFSRWERITRAGLSNVTELSEATIYAVSGGAPYTTGLLNFTRIGKINATLGSNDSPAVPQATGPSFRSGGFNGWTAGGQPSAANDIVASLMAVGMQPAAYNASGANKSRSTVLYRAYLEDLTVSGRAYAEVQAIDKTLFDQAFAAGGRYFGDTFTDPATLP